MSNFVGGIIVGVVVAFMLSNEKEPRVVQAPLPADHMIVTDIRDEWCKGPADVPIVGRTVQMQTTNYN